MGENARRILVVATLGRPDIVSMFDGLRDEADLTFVEYERNWGDGLDPGVYASLGELTTWESHRSASALLGHVRPDLVAMLATTSRNQIALRIEAGRQGVSVAHVEHGYRLPAEVRADPALAEPHRAGPRGSWRTNRFFAGSLRPSDPRRAFTLFAAGLDAARGGHGSAAEMRRPDRYISFAPECFEYHRVVDRVPAALATRTSYTGVPQFDSFRAGGNRPELDPGLAVMADHQLHNAGLRGWDERFREEWAKGVRSALRRRGMRLVVKRHPGDRTNPWEGDDAITEVDSIDELAAQARTAAVVLGTGSTLQLPLIGMPGAAAIALEIHPHRGPPLSGRVAEVGAAAPVVDFPALERALGRIDELREVQEPAKEDFVRRFLHRLDGGSGARMREALLGELPGGALRQ